VYYIHSALVSPPCVAVLCLKVYLRSVMSHRNPKICCVMYHRNI
jgi:hypothetical protein